MAGIGLQGAYGAAGAQEGFQQLLAQRMAERVYADKLKQQEFENMMRGKELQSTEELKRAQLDSLSQQRQWQEQNNLMQRGAAMNEAIPAGTALPANDPRLGALRMGGATLEHQDPTLASTQYSGAATLPGAPRPSGFLRTTSNPATPEQYIKGASFKQTSEAQAQADRDAERARQEARDAETARHNRADENKPVREPNPQPQVFYSPDGKPHAIQFVNGQSREVPLPGDFTGKTSPITNQDRNRMNAAQQVATHIPDILGDIEAADRAGALGPALGRWSDFMVGKVGSTGNPETDALMARLYLDISALKTGFSMVHGGARGGGSPQLAARFDKVLNARTMSKAALTSAISEVSKWLDTYAAGPGAIQPAASHGGNVSMIAPDGRKLSVPPDKVADLEAKGAKRAQ